MSHICCLCIPISSPPPSPHVPELRHARSNQTLKNPSSSPFSSYTVVVWHPSSFSFGFFNPAPDTGFELSCCESVVRTLIWCAIKMSDVSRTADNIGYKVVAATVVALFLAFAAVIMRFIARRYQGMRTYWEDWFIYMGLICKLGIDIGGILRMSNYTSIQ